MTSKDLTSEKEDRLHLFDQLLSRWTARKLITGSAKHLSYFIAAATVYQIAGGDVASIAVFSPVLGKLIDQLGSNVLANLLGTITAADKDGVSEAKLREILESEITKLNIQVPLTESEFYRAIRILSQRDEQRFESLASQISEVSYQLRLLHPSERAALSIFPRTSRPLMIDAPIIGREEELEWLSNLEQDSLLVGQPGTGKTFLLYRLVLKGNAVFLNTTDNDEIRSAFKIDAPQFLLVDDAHVSPEVLIDLRQMRNQFGLDFIILATSWPGDAELIKDRLMLSRSNVRELPRLNADQIVEIINNTGIDRPNSVIREIQEQADGRPGLALTLSEMYKKKDGGIDIWQGITLKNYLLHYQPLKDVPSQDVLGIFAIGGMKGMPLDKVAKVLGGQPLLLKKYIAKLSSAGLILEASSTHISVQPRALRYALIRDTFFVDRVQWWDIDDLIRHVPSEFDTLLEIMHAQSRGANVPQEWLRKKLEIQNSSELWMNYAALGEEQGEFVVKNHPDKVIQKSKSKRSLELFPDLVLPLFFEDACGDSRALAPNPDHSLRIIQDWIRSAPLNTQEIKRRREALFWAIKNWVENDSDSDVALRAISILMSPRYESHESDPGLGNSVTLTYGLPGLNDLQIAYDFWTEVLVCLNQLEISSWQPLQELFWEWVYPESVYQDVSIEIRKWMRGSARQMLRDIVPLVGNRQGILRWLQEMSDELDLELDISIDQDFMVLFPFEDRVVDESAAIDGMENWREEEEKQKNTVIQLADKWKTTDPSNVARKLRYIESEATFANLNWPRLTPLLCERIANEVSNYDEWLRAFISQELYSDLIEPFLVLAAQNNEDYWIELATKALEGENTRYASISVILRYSNLSQQVFRQANSRLGGYSSLVKTLCIRNQIPEDTLLSLLQHENDEIVTAVAIGEWRTEPKGIVRESLRQLWREVVLHRVPADEYSLAEILKSEPELSKEWLDIKIDGSSPIYSFEYRKSVPAAIASLETKLQKVYSEKLQPYQALFDW